MSYKRTSPMPVSEGGTGDATIANHGIVVGAGSGSLNTITPSAASGIPLISQGASANPIFGTATVPGGGTGAVTLTNHGVLIGQGTSTIVATAVGTTGQVLTGVTGADPVWASPAASSISITGDSGGALTGNSFTFTGGTTGLTFSGAASTETLTGTVNVAHGGTGNTTFTAYSVICAGTTATGAFQNVVGLGSAGNVLTSNGAGALPSWQSAGSGGITTINGDTGSATGSTITFTRNGSATKAGATVLFEAFGSTVALNTSDTLGNTLVGDNTGSSGTFAGSSNSGFGSAACTSLTSGNDNTGLGSVALNALQSGSRNSAVGFQALSALVSGDDNIVVGYASGSAYTTSESNNIIIGNSVTGTAAESNVIRIGASQTKCFVSGVASVSVSNKNYVTIDTTTGQLGSDSGPTSFTWSVITANQTAAVNNGYICNKAGTLTLALPATSAVGSIIEVTGVNTATGWQITQASGQQIFFGASSTTSGATGSLTSSAIRDAVRIVCITANTTWQVLSSIGNLTVA